MTTYLYGAAVQGIQAFIFGSNKLKEIVGASEMVEQICTEKFFKLLLSLEKKIVEKQKGDQKKKDYNNAILNAAGNIKYLFQSKDLCASIVKEFPKTITEFAPGITISQAVVKVEKGDPSKDDFDELERKLKVQRNKPFPPTEIALMAIERSRTTGSPAIKKDKESVYIDRSTSKKISEVDDAKDSLKEKLIKDDESLKSIKLETEIENIGTPEENSYVAIIHADGNSLGKFIQKLGSNKDSNAKKNFTKLSQALDNATTQAAHNAFKKVFCDTKQGNGNIPFRPIILGGDDLTVICQASKAIDFTENFLKEFEIKTKEKFTEEGLSQIVGSEDLQQLTACAGIAFVKKSFPFHYGIKLAEGLCSEAKKASKEINKKYKDYNYVLPSLAFHKLEGSYFRSFNDLKSRVLTIDHKEQNNKKQGDDKRQTILRLNLFNGPYRVETHYTGVRNEDTLIKLSAIKDKAKILQKEDAPKSQLREWFTLYHKSQSDAQEHIKRTIQVLKMRKNSYASDLELNQLKDPFDSDKNTDNKINKPDMLTQKKQTEDPRIKEKSTFVFDALVLASILKEEQKKSEEKNPTKPQYTES